MTADARRTIEELAARYELEPSLDDVYVEGSFDKEVFAASFLGTSLPTRTIYEIDSVEILPTVLAKHGLTNGSKQRVIALARELATLPVRNSCSYIVDRDLDHWFGSLESTPGLRWTRYCSIELHFFCPEAVHALLALTCKARIPNINAFLESLEVSLVNLYALRLADRELNWSMRWLPLEPCLTKTAVGVSVDIRTYVDRLLQTNGKAKQKADFNALAAAWRAKLGDECECRLQIRGHDFVDLLVWSVRTFRGVRDLASQVAVQRLLILLARGSVELREELRPNE